MAGLNHDSGSLCVHRFDTRKFTANSLKNFHEDALYVPSFQQYLEI